jgi:hypothetical protein
MVIFPGHLSLRQLLLGSNNSSTLFANWQFELLNYNKMEYRARIQDFLQGGVQLQARI